MLKTLDMAHDNRSRVEMVTEFLLKAGVSLAKFVLIFILLLSLTACAGLFGPPGGKGKSYVIKGKRYHILESADGFRQKGLASWYGEPFHGRKTASGEVYDMHRLSAAHKTLPLQTWVEVKNLENNRVMTVRINDRGPFVRGRVIDLSRAAAQEMGMLQSGVAKVSLKAVTGERARQLTAAYEKQLAEAGTLLASAPASPAPSAGEKSPAGKNR